jgi:hypothetical protein
MAQFENGRCGCWEKWRREENTRDMQAIQPYIVSAAVKLTCQGNPHILGFTVGCLLRLLAVTLMHGAYGAWSHVGQSSPHSMECWASIQWGPCVLRERGHPSALPDQRIGSDSCNPLYFACSSGLFGLDSALVRGGKARRQSAATRTQPNVWP